MVRGYIIFLFLLAASSVQAIEFDAEKAWNNLTAQCAFGPRHPGSTGHQKCLLWLESELKKYSGSVQRQSFIGRDGATNKSHSLTNLIAHFPGQRPEYILLCAHWDTRPWADMDPDLANRHLPILGANDGASGVAVLLEMARCLSLQKPPVSVKIALFDGEDLGREGHLNEYLQGSREYVRTMKFPLPSAVILLDMVGDKDLLIPQESYSLRYSRDLVQEIFGLAARMNQAAFYQQIGTPVYDDHVPFLEAGIPGVDIIDFDYPFWHTLQDTPENCSAKSLGTVGKVLWAWLRSQ